MSDLLDLPGVKVFELKGSDEVTTSIGKQASMDEASLRAAVDVASGNPGAMVYLGQLWQKLSPADFSCLCAVLLARNLRGSDMYSFVKSKGVDGAVAEFRKAGWL